MKLFDRRFKYTTLNHSGAQVRRRRLSMFYLAVVARRLGGRGRGNISRDDRNTVGGPCAFLRVAPRLNQYWLSRPR